MNAQVLYKQIYAKYQLGPANHMTHLDNVAGILDTGELRAYNLMRGHFYRNLANDDVQAGRAAKVAVNQTHNEDLVFIRFSLDLLAMGGVVITDGNARSDTTRFRVYTQLADLDLIDPKAINTVKYAGDPELKRKKQAEVLVPDRLPLTYPYDFIYYSAAARQRLLDIFDHYGKKFRICVSSGNWYFRTPRQGNP